jgi:chemotaxis protein methyltransferase CheR
MSNGASLDQLCDLVTGRLGLARQNLRRDKLDPHVESRLASVLMDERDLAADAWQTIVSAVTIPETRFLRQRGWFRQIELLALAPLIKQRREQGQRRLRIWSAGCATGEEAYTVALLVRDLLPDLGEWHVEILATDISSVALRDAERGCYAERQLRELDAVQISKHFAAAEGNRRQVRPELRSLVRFQVANLVDDAVYSVFESAFDLIICRNVLIYLTAEMQRRVAGNLAASLRHDGWLAVAPAEAIVEWFRPLTAVNAPETILFHKGRRELSHPAPKPAAAPGEAAIVRTESPARRNPRVDRAAPPQSPTLQEIRRFADRGALDEARTHCNDLIAADRLNGAAYLLLSAICTELGDYPTACDAARRAIYLEPDSAEAHFQMAGILRNLGQTNRAERSLAIAARLATVTGANHDRDP